MYKDVRVDDLDEQELEGIVPPVTVRELAVGLRKVKKRRVSADDGLVSEML